MAINFIQGQVSQGDPNPGGPSATSNIKDKQTKVIKLTSANFTTTNVDVLGAVLPADSTVLNVDYYVKTILSGGTISAATVSIGSASGGTQYVNAFNVFSASGTSGPVTPVTGIMQNYAVPLGPDLQFWIRGTATTGNPTAGEIYIIITYVR